MPTYKRGIVLLSSPSLLSDATVTGRRIRRAADAPRVRRAPGFEVAQLHPQLFGAGMDPPRPRATRCTCGRARRVRGSSSPAACRCASRSWHRARS